MGDLTKTVFEKLDRNHDGRVTKQDIKDLVTASLSPAWMSPRINTTR